MIYALIAADVIMALTFFLKYSHLPGEIPLFYSRGWGEDQLTDIWYIFLLPLLLHLGLFANGYIYNRFFFPDSFIKRILNIINWGLIIGYAAIFCRILFFIT